MALFPTGPIQKVSGTAIAVPGEDIDTDRIIPARFLKCVSFEALGGQVFADDRLELSGEHPFDQARYQGASILVLWTCCAVVVGMQRPSSWTMALRLRN